LDMRALFPVFDDAGGVFLMALKAGIGGVGRDCRNVRGKKQQRGQIKILHFTSSDFIRIAARLS
jgi:hypothetical protein